MTPGLGSVSAVKASKSGGASYVDSIVFDDDDGCSDEVDDEDEVTEDEIESEDDSGPKV